MQDAEVAREPVNPVEDQQDIDEMFAINAPVTKEQLISCEIIQRACRQMAHLIIENVPEGRERNIAVNNILSAALMARHGITRKPVLVVSCSSSSSDSNEKPTAANT